MAAGKQIRKVAVQNPDKKLATRGYVKCIARGLRDHSHKQNLPWVTNMLAATASTMILIIIIVMSWATYPVRIPEPMYWSLVTFAAVAWLLAVQTTDDLSTGTPEDNDCLNDIISKWEPPCEDDDCNDYF